MFAFIHSSPSFPQTILVPSKPRNGFPVRGSSPPPAPPSTPLHTPPTSPSPQQNQSATLNSTPIHTPPTTSPLCSATINTTDGSESVKDPILDWVQDPILEWIEDDQVDAEVGNDFTDIQHTTYYIYAHRLACMYAHTPTHTSIPSSPPQSSSKLWNLILAVV